MPLTRKYFVQNQAVLRYQYLFDPDLSYEDAVRDIIAIVKNSRPPMEITGHNNQPLLLFTAIQDGVKFRVKVDQRPGDQRDHVISVCKPYRDWIPAGLGQEERFGVKVYQNSQE